MEGTPEQQVQQLKKEYERRVAEIQKATETGERSSEIAPEHQAVSEVTENMIQEQDPGFKASSHEPGRTADELPEEAQAKVRSWVSLALNDPSAGVKAAKDSGDPSLFDPLHKALTSNEVFQEMVKRGKLPELK